MQFGLCYEELNLNERERNQSLIVTGVICLRQSIAIVLIFNSPLAAF